MKCVLIYFFFLLIFVPMKRLHIDHPTITQICFFFHCFTIMWKCIIPSLTSISHLRTDDKVPNVVAAFAPTGHVCLRTPSLSLIPRVKWGEIQVFKLCIAKGKSCFPHPSALSKTHTNTVTCIADQEVTCKRREGCEILQGSDYSRLRLL